MLYALKKIIFIWNILEYLQILICINNIIGTWKEESKLFGKEIIKKIFVDSLEGEGCNFHLAVKADVYQSKNKYLSYLFFELEIKMNSIFTYFYTPGFEVLLCDYTEFSNFSHYFISYLFSLLSICMIH